MIIFVTVILLVGSCTARPNEGVDTQNVVTVPPNCPPGQEWVNGQCRDIWRAVTAAPTNLVTVPTNCPAGQEWVNGQCRDVWRAVTAEPSNVVTVPTNCPAGQEWVNGQCRDIWRAGTAAPANLVTVPTNCPAGQEWVNGQCRDIWRAATAEPSNVVTVPTNCPKGQEYVNGQCRDIWIKMDSNLDASNAWDTFFEDLRQIITRKERHAAIPAEFLRTSDPNKNVISVPNQCPAGYRPDALGVCRPIM